MNSEQIPNPLRLWGWGGAFFAAAFALWMYFFPDYIKPFFAWPTEPRLAQAFIGAGYVFRTAYFLAVAREPLWHKVRWLYWGNLVFTGVLLLATFWHAEKFKWAFPLSTGHLWLFLYMIEPIAMIYLTPRHSSKPQTGVPLVKGFKLFLIVEASLLAAFGSLLVINPAFANQRWPWELNPLDARIIAAWFLGWATWAGTMAFADDWHEIRMAAQVNLVFGAALLMTNFVFQSSFDFTRPNSHSYGWAIAVLTAVMGYFYWRQETARRRQ